MGSYFSASVPKVPGKTSMDEGILRRLGTRILVDVPDTADRERILTIHLKDEPLSNDLDVAELAQVTPDYTGSDLNNLVTAAARYAGIDNMKQMGVSFEFGGQTQAESSQIRPPVSVPADRVSRRTTCRARFIRAREEIRPAPKSETVSLIREFDNMNGSTGSSGRSVQIANKEKPIVTM
ncbi:mitochondrial ATPase, aaa-type [Grosmannia clavigera kw1407]|uniref:Mitochondrial ATPase, aaa-type n=1 Tax=Grosmannia clavigera (strain kw1407 / UAMH 11150) TaxID=655863 RepID=F0XUA8_GROCL|nr:mitochondrial ATPase, aaa-type [Grosmannia clavigera kw1407]EFW98622.1 mitochondrial ATPase, aaa-type [Grosmannia clavigera kw1407]